jgi:uncharacterized small protein (DUF1192 family)
MDDLELPPPSRKPKALDPMSVDELEAYIKALEAEIDRARQMIASKQNARKGADEFFGF